MTDLISIVIPIYNSEKYLDNTLSSVLTQSYKNLEIILVNDGSTDSSADICKKFAAQDKRITLVNTKNSGVSSARNTGIKHANGIYIQFTDSDDRLDADYISELYHSMTAAGSDLHICSMRYESSDSSHTDISMSDFFCNKEDFSEELMCELVKNYLFFSPCNKLYKLDIIKKKNLIFPKEFSYGEDLLFNFYYFDNIESVSFSKSTSYIYQLFDSESLSRSVRPYSFENEKYLQAYMKAFFNKYNLYAEKMRELLMLRLFDCGYNSIAYAGTRDFKGGLYKRYKRIRCIINDDEFRDSLALADRSLYSEKVLDAIEMREAFVLFVKFVLVK